jgi:hypothetical protein
VAQLAEERGRRRAGTTGEATRGGQGRRGGRGTCRADFFCSPHAVQNKRSCGSDYEGDSGERRHLATLLGFSRRAVGALPNRLLDSYV